MTSGAGDLAAQLRAEFPRALRDRQVVGYFQPEIELSSGRLVAAELERRWESALHDFRQAESELERENQTMAIPLLVTQKIRNAFQNIGKKMPVVWQQGLMSQDKKKALLRCLIDKIVIHRSARDRLVSGGDNSSNLSFPQDCFKSALTHFASAAASTVTQPK